MLVKVFYMLRILMKKNINFFNKQEILCFKHLNGCKAFNKYSNDKDGICIAFKDGLHSRINQNK